MRNVAHVFGSTCLVLIASPALLAQKVTQTGIVPTPRPKPASLAPAPHLAPPPAPLLGGSDACATPDAIVGTGNFAFDTTAATTGIDGQGELLCFDFQTFTPAIDQDVWFSWVAPASGVATLQTCGLTSVDTKLAAYPATGGCPVPNTALACNDDACSSLQSRIQFACSSGVTYLFQVGVAPGAVGGVGQFQLSIGPVPLEDNCATPLLVSGAGPHPFDTFVFSAGAQGQAEAICFFNGTTAIDRDSWFTWTAPASGPYAVVTEGLTTLDTKIAVYAGSGCPTGSALGCNDDGGVSDLQSISTFVATAGSTYTIQVGVAPASLFFSVGAGEFVVIPAAPQANDNCSTPTSWSGQGDFLFDSTFSSTGAQGQSEALCNIGTVIGIDADSWYAWIPDASGTATVQSCPGTQIDTKMAVYAGSGCPLAGTALDCDDDSCGGFTGLQSELTFAVTCGQTYLIQVGNYPSGGQAGGLGRLHIQISGTPCSTPSTPFCIGSAVGTSCLGCGNNGASGRGCANSSFAAGGLLTSTGFASLASDTLVLTASDIPGPGLFFQADGLAGSPISFGDGMLCAATGILRMGVVFPVAGVASYPGGLTPNPIHIAGAPITPGTPKHYQCWYRDAAAFCTSATFNLTQGLSLIWTP